MGLPGADLATAAPPPVAFDSPRDPATVRTASPLDRAATARRRPRTQRHRGRQVRDVLRRPASPRPSDRRRRDDRPCCSRASATTSASAPRSPPSTCRARAPTPATATISTRSSRLQPSSPIPPRSSRGCGRGCANPNQAPSTDGVAVSTVHRVKGMEWPYVIVLGAHDGLMPHALADDLEEERRIFHVAITRGDTAVHVVADAKSPAPFLDELTAPGTRELRRTRTAPRGHAAPEARRRAAHRRGAPAARRRTEGVAQAARRGRQRPRLHRVERHASRRYRRARPHARSTNWRVAPASARRNSSATATRSSPCSPMHPERGCGRPVACSSS